MALTISCDNTDVLTLEELLDHVQTHVDLADFDSVAACAPHMHALANDSELVVREINRQIKNAFKGNVLASAQVIFLGEGDGFFVRANVWPSAADIATGRVYQDQVAYHLAHDHNYNFMTVAYSGPGYITDLYEYDYEKLEGDIGEPVDLHFMERVHFTTGMAMLYRRSKDVHIQYPPDKLSITLNLMISDPEIKTRDQYSFDIGKGTLLNYPTELDATRRLSLIEMAGLNGDAETQQLLKDLAQKHTSRRARLAAYESLANLAPADSVAIWGMATRDREPLVVNAARRKLEFINRG